MIWHQKLICLGSHADFKITRLYFGHSNSELWTVRLTLFLNILKTLKNFEVFKKLFVHKKRIVINLAVFSKGIQLQWTEFGLELKVPFWGYYFYLVCVPFSVIIQVQKPFCLTMTSSAESKVRTNIIHCTKTNKNERKISQWRLFLLTNNYTGWVW